MDKSEFRLIFGTWLRSKRKQCGKTIEQVSACSGLSKGNLSEIERGIIGATFLKSIALAESVDCKLQDFLDLYNSYPELMEGE